MEITFLVWIVVAELKNIGRTVGKGNTSSLKDYNKNQLFRSCLRNPHAAMRGFHVEGLSMNAKILAFLVL